jgi:two-component system phosphate regulon sensor histidine kinase PhoR
MLGGVSIYVIHFLQQSYLESTRTRLLAEARALADQLAPVFEEGAPYARVDLLADAYAQLVQARTTIILPDGVVIGESDYLYSRMENHSSRPEFQQAVLGKEYSETRYSSTLRTNLMYAAVPIWVDGQVVGVTRLAVSLQGLEAEIKVLRSAVWGASGVALILAVLLAFLITRQTTHPLRELTRSVQGLKPGETLSLSESTRQDEIGRLSRAFEHLTAQLNQQIQDLRAERGKLTAVLVNMSDAILIVDGEGKVRLLNPAAMLLFNVDEIQALGASLVTVVRNHQFIELWRKCTLSGEPQTAVLEIGPEQRFIQAAAASLAPTIPNETLLVLHDLTRVRRLETVRRDFVSNVSHELRTPLASLKALAETLQEGALEDPPVARRFLQQMEHEIDNLTQMVRELLELSRIESGRVPLERKWIAATELVTPAIERMKLQAERAGLTLVLDCPADLPQMWVDRERIEQVLVNLLHNAIKFTAPGGTVTVQLSARDGRLLIAVRDTGVGIEPDALERIFERFYKADKARSGGGTGLGLSIARHLVEAHGGRIWAESKPGAGSVFWIALPILVE